MTTKEGTGKIHGLALCSGVGGLELGVQLAIPNYEVVCYVEREIYAVAQTLSRIQDGTRHDAPIWDDVATFDGRPWRDKIHILSGGYPCQPFSLAGRRAGADDHRHLWPHIARIIAECRPSICFFENVRNHVRMGFDAVYADLRELGYDVKAGIYSAAELGAPHNRQRLFIMAYAQNQRHEWAGTSWGWGNESKNVANSTGERLERCEQQASSKGASECSLLSDQNSNVGNADQSRLERRQQPKQRSIDELYPWTPGPEDISGWTEFIQQNPTLEPAVFGTPHGIASRVDQIIAIGNSVVPAVARFAWVDLNQQLAPI